MQANRWTLINSLLEKYSSIEQKESVLSVERQDIMHENTKENFRTKDETETTVRKDHRDNRTSSKDKEKENNLKKGSQTLPSSSSESEQ